MIITITFSYIFHAKPTEHIVIDVNETVA